MNAKTKVSKMVKRIIGENFQPKYHRKSKSVPLCPILPYQVYSLSAAADVLFTVTLSARLHKTCNIIRLM